MKETLSGFGKIMDPNKWNSTVWYRVIRYPQVFRGLIGDQWTPEFWGVTPMLLFNHSPYKNECYMTSVTFCHFPSISFSIFNIMFKCIINHPWMMDLSYILCFSFTVIFFSLISMYLWP